MATATEEICLICTRCNQNFSVSSSFLASREIDVCVACFRVEIARRKTTGPPPIFRPDYIDLNIYLGGYRCATDLNTLVSLNITRIIICGSGLKQCFPEQVNYLQFEIEDEVDQDLRCHFQEAYDFISTAKDNVLVHCHAGISRSATIVLSYLMRHKSITFAEASEFLATKRKCIRPNSGFVKQLEKYENEILNSGLQNIAVIAV